MSAPIEAQTAFRKQHVLAARRGAKLLDKLDPKWFQHIDLKTLDLGSVSRCMLGQRYGDYSEGLDQITDALNEARIRFEKALREYSNDVSLAPLYYGFEADAGNEWLGTNRQFGYSILTEAWTREVEKRMPAEFKAERARRRA